MIIRVRLGQEEKEVSQGQILLLSSSCLFFLMEMLIKKGQSFDIFSF